MSPEIKSYIKRSNENDWLPLIEEGIDTSGMFVKALRIDETNQRPITFLLKLEQEVKYPYHNHPAGEELVVLKGSCIIEGETLLEGDYLHTPPDFKHSVKTNTGCVLFFIVPEEVEIINKI